MRPEADVACPLVLAANAVTIPVPQEGRGQSGHRASGKPTCSHTAETQVQGWAARACLQAATAVLLGHCLPTTPIK